MTTSVCSKLLSCDQHLFKNENMQSSIEKIRGGSEFTVLSKQHETLVLFTCVWPFVTMGHSEKSLEANELMSQYNSSNFPSKCSRRYTKRQKKKKRRKKGSSTRKTERKKPQSRHCFHYTLQRMGKKHILGPHESERCTLYLLNFNKTDALINVWKILSLIQKCRRCNWLDKYEAILQLQGRHLWSQPKQEA